MARRNQDRSTANELPFCTLDEVAEICRASLGSVRFWVRTGKLESVRPGRRRLVRRADLDRFLGGGARRVAS